MPYPLEMIQEHPPLVCDTTRSDNRIAKYVQGNLTAQVVGHLEHQQLQRSALAGK